MGHCGEHSTPSRRIQKPLGAPWRATSATRCTTPTPTSQFPIAAIPPAATFASSRQLERPERRVRRCRGRSGLSRPPQGRVRRDNVQLRRPKRGETSIVDALWPPCETRCASSSKDLEMELYYASLVCILPNTTTAVRITAVRKTVLK